MMRLRHADAALLMPCFDANIRLCHAWHVYAPLMSPFDSAAAFRHAAD